MPETTLPFSTMNDAELRACLDEHGIGLTPDEARAVEKMIGRAPTLTEATIWGIQGSEHCSYKSSRRFLKGFVTDGKHVILGPKEDSGIIAITDGPKGKRWGLVMSHESHNHPSQIVPYEGAATGVGGCVRDVACMGARVIGALDSLRLGDLKSDESRSIASEVIRGIAGYGNALGIPNLGGDTVFDAGYNDSCLVNVVSLGIIREDEIIHSYAQAEAGKEKYDIIIVGKPTDKSGFGGASFASATMQEEDKEKNAGAVQEPNPFLERHILASSYALFDWLVREKKLDKVSFKDLGAGGNVCASVEQVAPVGMGAVLDLEKIHTSLRGLPAEVIGCAETQERFCWICHPSLTEHILRHYNETWDLPSVAEGARASVVGHVIEEDRYVLRHNGETVCDAKSTDITSGLQYVRPTKKPDVTFTEPEIQATSGGVSVAGKNFSFRQIFEALIAHPSYASKSRVFRHYDKNILGNTFIEPGEAGASVIMPLQDIQSYEIDGKHPGWVEDLEKSDAHVGVALTVGGNGRYGRISPYLQGVNAVAEAVRNIASVGAVPRAITDCLNYGNPEIPEQLWALEEGVRGVAETAKALAFGGEAIPVISGNVSLYNATKEGPIDPTANVCIAGVMKDGRKAINMHFKSVGSSLYLLAERKNECGGSAYYQILEQLSGAKTNALLGANVPSPDLKKSLKEALFVIDAVDRGLVLSSQDISEGGLVLALFEMMTPWRAVKNSFGVRIDLANLSSSLAADTILFSETGGFVLEVPSEKTAEFERALSEASVESWKLGTVRGDGVYSIRSGDNVLLEAQMKDLLSVWSSSLTDALKSL